MFIMCLAILAVPAIAAAVPDATISTDEYGWCCGGSTVTVDGEFRGYEFGIENIGTDPLTMDTLRVTFDPRQYQWDTGSDSVMTDSEVYAGFDDGGWNETFSYAPLSSSPSACVEESATSTVVVYACDLEATPIAVGDTGWTGLKALVPATGFAYGSAGVTYSVSFVGDPIPPLTSVTNIDYVDINSNLQVQGGYVGDPDLVDAHWSGDYRDFDGESTGTQYEAGDLVPFKLLLTNPMHDADPTGVAHGITIDFNIPTDAAGDFETQFQDGDESATGGLSNPDCTLDSDNGTDQDWTCTFDGAVPVGGSSTITLPILLVDGVDYEYEFDVETTNGTIDSIDDPQEQTYASTDSCELPRFFGATGSNPSSDESNRYQMIGLASIADVESGDPIRFELPCLEPEAAPLTNYSSTTGIWDLAAGYSNPGSHAGIFRGPANATYGWLSDEPVAPGPNGAYAFTWESTALAGVSAGDVVDTARIAARPAAGGDYYRIMFHVTAQSQSDVSASLVGPPAIEVATGGSQATYTATLSNAGPDAAAAAKVAVLLPATARFDSSTGATPGDSCVTVGQLVTCTAVNLASGASRAFTVRATYTAGVAGLALPTTVSATATAHLPGASSEDPNAGNDASTFATSLTAPPQTTTPTLTCPSGTIGTYPNCIKPRRFVGDGSNQTFVGGNGNDRLVGGSGEDRFIGGKGSDRALGGGGNDTLFGGPGDDTLQGGAGADRVFGGPGIDLVSGGGGDDLVSCGAGGAERAFGGFGDDVVICLDNRPGDTVNGGPGVDRCVGDVGDVFVGCEDTVQRRLSRP